MNRNRNFNTIFVTTFIAFFTVSRAYDNGARFARLPTLGWSSWVALGPGAEDPVFDYCDEFSIKAAADAFIEVGLFDAGYRHFHLDDCWAGTSRNATGYLIPEADHFPNGMKPVVDYVNSKGLVFGLYTCGGPKTCVGNREGSQGHWEQDAQLFAEWGVEWVKMDWCGGVDILGSYGNMSKALNATGKPITFSMCEWGLDSPWIWGDEYSQEWRMSGDHTATWDSTKEIIVSSGLIPANYSGRPYGWNGMDMLETGCAEQCAHANGKQANMTATEYKTEFSMWSISASPLIITTRIMNCTNTTGVVTCNGWLSDLQKEIMLNTEVIAINQDVTPQGRPIVEGDFSVWARHLSDGSIAVALLNLNDQPAGLLVEFLNLGWPAGQSASVRDLWAHTDLGTFKDQYPNSPITVAPHETHLIRLTPA